MIVQSKKQKTDILQQPPFLDASLHLYKWACPLVCWSFGWSIHYHFVLAYLLVSQDDSGRLRITLGNSCFFLQILPKRIHQCYRSNTTRHTNTRRKILRLPQSSNNIFIPSWCHGHKGISNTHSKGGLRSTLPIHTRWTMYLRFNANEIFSAYSKGIFFVWISPNGHKMARRNFSITSSNSTLRK